MDISHLTFSELLLLISPCLIGIAIFGYLLWSDERYYKQRENLLN